MGVAIETPTFGQEEVVRYVGGSCFSGVKGQKPAWRATMLELEVEGEALIVHVMLDVCRGAAAKSFIPNHIMHILTCRKFTQLFNITETSGICMTSCEVAHHCGYHI